MARKTIDEVYAERGDPDTPELHAVAADTRRRIAFAELVHRLRVDANLTQAELAERMETSRTAVARMEAAGTTPTFATLAKLAEATGVPLRLVADGIEGLEVTFGAVA